MQISKVAGLELGGGHGQIVAIGELFLWNGLVVRTSKSRGHRVLHIIEEENLTSMGLSHSLPPSIANMTAVRHFPPMASSQGSVPNVRPPSGLVRTSSLGTPSSAWMPLQSSSYSSGLPLQAPPYASPMPPSIKERGLWR